MAIAFNRMEKPLRQLRSLLGQFPQDPAPGAVHRLRTRSRQVEALAAALPPSGEKLTRRLLKSIKSVRKAAGRVRDMDVLAAHAHTLPAEPYGAALARLIAYLGQSREKHARELLQTIAERRKTARDSLKSYARQMEIGKDSAAFAREAEELVHAAEARITAEISRRPTLTARNLHAFRLNVKELRSTLQLLSAPDRDFIDALGVVKDKIGEWHDWLQLGKTAAQVLDARQDRALLAAIQETRRHKLREALLSAQSLRQALLDRSAGKAPRKPPLAERRPPALSVTDRPNRVA